MKGQALPIRIEGAGLIDSHLYRQKGRLVLHLVNLTNENTWRQSLDELVPIGPVRVWLRLPEGLTGHSLLGLVSGLSINAANTGGWCHFEVPSITDHEVVVIT